MRMLSDELLDKLGDFYASEYVQNNQPWLREKPFHLWLEQEIRKLICGT